MMGWLIGKTGLIDCGNFVPVTYDNEFAIPATKEKKLFEPRFKMNHSIMEW